MPKGLTPFGRRQIMDALMVALGTHDEHAWKQVGRCVYCVDCNERLFQGRIPSEHTNVATSSRISTPRETIEMREKWGMDAR